MLCGAQATGRPLFDDFSSVAERVGVYTASDYADIMEHLIKRWEVEGRELSGEAAEAQVHPAPCTFPPSPVMHTSHRLAGGRSLFSMCSWLRVGCGSVVSTPCTKPVERGV
jgi:hypothetical protein